MNEEVVQFGESGTLVGIVTEPPAQSRRSDAPGVILLNAGFIHRIGPYRLNVNLARDLASAGLTVLRFDLSGIGDSRLRRDNLPIEKSAALEAREAMDFLQASKGARRFILMGLCSGAENAVRVAGIDPRVAGAVCMNYQGDANDPVIADRYHARYYLRRALFDLRSWARFLGGKSDYRSVVRLVGLRIWSQLSPAARSSPKAREVAKNLRALRARGVPLLLVYSEGDPGLDYIRYYLGDEIGVLKASGRVRVEIVEGGNHMFAPLAVQERLVRMVHDWVLAP